MHPIIRSAKNRGLKYRDLTTSSPHPPSHCLPSSKQRTTCNYLAFSRRLTLLSTVSFWHWCTAHKQHTVWSSSSIPPPATFSIHRKSKLLSSPIGQCPGEGSRTVTQFFCHFHRFLSSYCLFLSHKSAQLPLRAQFLLIHFTFNLNGLSSGHDAFHQFFCLFWTHWLAHVRQTRQNNQSSL